MKQKNPFIQLSEKTVHIGAFVHLNEEKIIENGRGKHLDLYRSINPKIVQYIQIEYYEWANHLNVQCLVGNYWFEINELNVKSKYEEKKKKKTLKQKILEIITFGILFIFIIIGAYFGGQAPPGLW